MNEKTLYYEEELLSEGLSLKLNRAFKALPHMSIKKTNVGDAANVTKSKIVDLYWKIKYTIQGWFTALVGIHFVVQMVKVINGTFCWVQPFIYPLLRKYKTWSGNVVSTGFVISFESNNEILMTVANEPGAKEMRFGKKRTRPTIRPFIQMSIQKGDDVLIKGQIEKDPVLAQMLRFAKIENLKWRPTSLGDANKGVNRVWKSRSMVVSEQLNDISNSCETIISLDRYEARELVLKRPDLLNSHALEILSDFLLK